MWKVVALCFLAALFEGMDIQSMGVVAPHVAPAFALDPQEMGIVLSASTFGLMIGAWLGGWASDRFGRKAILALSMATFGLSSLLTTTAGDYPTLVAIRVLTGLGLGGALPNLIALATDIAPPHLRVSLLGVIYGGMPFGGAMAGAISGWVDPQDWKLVFLVGGIGPLVLVPLLLWLLPSHRGREPMGTIADVAFSGSQGLFGERKRQTLLLWTAYFFTLLAVYLLLNWLPSLMVEKGLDKAAAARSAIFLNAGAVIGSLVLGQFADRRSGAEVLKITYAGMVASLLVVSMANEAWVMAAAFCAGFFVIGGQLVLYALAPTIYPPRLRGAGIGAAVSVGRAGSVAGPLLGGFALGHGFAPALVPVIAGPGLIVAVVAAIALAARHTFQSDRS